MEPGTGEIQALLLQMTLMDIMGILVGVSRRDDSHFNPIRLGGVNEYHPTK